MGSGTGIGRVRGLGSAKSGAHHWWLQRVTAAGNIVLVLWFFISLLRLPSLAHESVVRWLQSPLVPLPLILLTVLVFLYFPLGLPVFIADFSHECAARIAALSPLNFYTSGGPPPSTFPFLLLSLIRN